MDVDSSFASTCKKVITHREFFAEFYFASLGLVRNFLLVRTCMQLSTYQIQLPLTHPFTISRGTIAEQTSLIVRLESQGIVGWGEVTQNRYYQRTIESLNRSIIRAASMLQRIGREPPACVWPELMKCLEGDTFAVSALDIAVHDWHAKLNGQQIWQSWGLTWNDVPVSSYTLAIDTADVMVSKLKEQPGWPIYKIKLGCDNDLEIVQQLRQHTPARFRVDANCGWDAEQTIQNSVLLKELGVEFIEQPMPRESALNDLRQAFELSRLPIIADESCQIESDVSKCAEKFHGINIKICKCGGLTPALRMIQEARSLGMKTMVGCMVESSIAISAAAQLLPSLDFADLDGSALLADDPACGAKVANGQVTLSGLPGHGGYLPDQALAKAKQLFTTDI